MCISKISGGGGGVYLGEEFHGGERELWWPDDEIAEDGGGGERMKRRKRERRRMRKKEAQPNRYARKGASLAGALLWSKGASEGGALLSTVTQAGCHVYTPRRHHSWRSPVNQWRQALWRPTVGFRYGISFLRGLFIKITF
jgi:hypothetical protein